MTKDVQDLMNAVERVRDRFHRALFVESDPDAVRALAAEGCEVSVLPTGATIADELVLPADLAFRRVSRTGDRWQVADEDVVTFTHDRELPWLLPGVAATHRAVEVLVITVVGVRRGMVTHYRALWDQVTLLDQLGVGSGPTSGVEPANVRSSSA